jgi:hypothetical protein
MKRRTLFLVFAISSAISSSAFARNEAISISQGSDSAITATIDGLIYFCDAELGYFDGAPSASISGTDVTITSYIQQGECNPPPGPPPPPSPYSISLSLGMLPDGFYALDWQYVYKGYLDGPPQPPPLQHYASFIVENGELAIFKGDFENSN